MYLPHFGAGGPQGLRGKGLTGVTCPSFSNLVGPSPAHGEAMRKPPSASRKGTEGFEWQPDCRCWGGVVVGSCLGSQKAGGSRCWGCGEMQDPGLSGAGFWVHVSGFLAACSHSASPSTLWRPWGRAVWQEGGKLETRFPIPHLPCHSSVNCLTNVSDAKSLEFILHSPS